MESSELIYLSCFRSVTDVYCAMKMYDMQYRYLFDVVVYVIHSDNSVPDVVVVLGRRRRRCCSSCQFVRASCRCQCRRCTSGNQRLQDVRWWPMVRPRTLEPAAVTIAAWLRQPVAQRRLWQLDERRWAEQRWRRLAVSRTWKAAENSPRSSQNSSSREQTLDDGGQATYRTARQVETVVQWRVGLRTGRAGDAAVVRRTTVQRLSTMCRRWTHRSCSLSVSSRYHWNLLWTRPVLQRHLTFISTIIDTFWRHLKTYLFT